MNKVVMPEEVLAHDKAGEVFYEAKEAYEEARGVYDKAREAYDDAKEARDTAQKNCPVCNLFERKNL